MKIKFFIYDIGKDLFMKMYRGSFTIEAAFIMPIILGCICIAIKSGVTLYQEVKNITEQIIEEKQEELIDSMYRKELLESLLKT